MRLARLVADTQFRTGILLFLLASFLTAGFPGNAPAHKELLTAEEKELLHRAEQVHVETPQGGQGYQAGEPGLVERCHAFHPVGAVHLVHRDYGRYVELSNQVRKVHVEAFRARIFKQQYDRQVQAVLNSVFTRRIPDPYSAPY